jgi:hypothetical protein
MQNTQEKLARFEKAIPRCLKFLEKLPQYTGEKRERKRARLAEFLTASIEIAGGLYAKDHPRVKILKDTLDLFNAEKYKVYS